MTICTHKNEVGKEGFTLVELMIALAIAGVVMAGIYMTFRSQHDSYLTQDEVTTMQQNIRSGMYYLQRDIRMAGYNPSNLNPIPPVTIRTVSNQSIRFLKANETNTLNVDDVTYSYNAANRTVEMGLNGNPPVVVAEDIEDIRFAYAYDADDDGYIETYTDASGADRVIWAVPVGGFWENLDFNNDGDIDELDSATPGTLTNEALNTVNTGDSVDENEIKAVRISILARTGRGDRGFSNNFTYIVGDQEITPINDGDLTNDNCRMRLLTTIVNCRNMGI